LSSCPVRTMLYGGLPGDGGFGRIREFGVGLANIFEAAHCVLGSLGRHLGKNRDNWSSMIRTETGHLNEEVGIIRNAIREYSRPIYRQQMMMSDLDDYFPQHREMIKESTRRQVEDIREAGAKLASTARTLGRQFAENLRDEGAPTPWVNLSAATYLFVRSLADAAVESVAHWPDEVGDPFSNPKVIKYINLMEKHLRALLAWTPDRTANRRRAMITIRPAARRVARRHFKRRAFVSNPVVHLRNYLNMDDHGKGLDLIDNFPYRFIEWLRDNEYDDLADPEIQNTIEDGYSDDPYRLPKELVIEFFGDMESSFMDYDADSPSWLFMDDPKIVKNQWMIHFTNDADAIACQGFKYGMDDFTRLGLTTHIRNTGKPGGYNFAYDVDEWERYAHGRHGFKYGDEAVLFRASGVKVWHHGDGEYQIVFVGATAKDIVPLTKGGYGGGWWANGRGKGGREEQDSEQGDGSFDSLSEAVDWVTANYNQYKRLLTC